MSEGILQNGNRKILVFCTMITLGINTPTFLILNQHWGEIQALEELLHEKTNHPYLKRDAASHDALVNQRFNNVYYRFEINEAKIAHCELFIDKHREIDHRK
jgi:hypothetical protein